MKTLLLLFLILLITSPAFGQATNTFPSTGNAGVGTTTPADLLTLYTSTDTYPLHVIGDGTGGGIVMNGFYNGPDAGGGFHGFFARGSYASPSIVQSGDRLGYYISSGYVGAAPNLGYVNATAINGYVGTGTISSTSLPGYLTFETEPSGAVTRTERMRIDQNGNVGIGTTAPTTLLHVAGITRANQFIIGETTDTYNGSIEITYSDATNYGIYLEDTNSGTTNAPALQFQRTGSSVGSIGLTFTSTSYNTTSDRRLKENIIDTTSGLEQLMQIPVHDFNFIRDPKKIREQGLIAQELYKIYPEAVTPGGDDPKKKPWAIDYGRLTPLLLKAIQEQQKEIDTLKQELGSLEKQPTQQKQSTPDK